MSLSSQPAGVSREHLDDDELRVLEEVVQLKRTLDTRVAEIALAVERTEMIEAKAKQIRTTSLVVTSKEEEMARLEEALSAATQRNADLRDEIERTRHEITMLHHNRCAIRRSRLTMCQSAKPLAEQMIQIAAHQRKMEKNNSPMSTVSSLLGLLNGTVTQFEDATKAFTCAEAELEEQTKHVQEIHRSCLDEVNAAAAEKEAQKQQLERAWEREKKHIEGELRMVTARAREAAFHSHRGTSMPPPKQANPADYSSRYIRELRSEVTELQRNLQRYGDVKRSDGYADALSGREHSAPA